MNPRILIRQNPNSFLRLNGVETWSKQNAIVDAVFANKEVAVKSSNAVGKTFTAAALSLVFLLAYESALVITTAPTFPQVEQILWREIHKMNAHAKQPFVPFNKMNTVSINLGADHYATGRSTNLESNFQGYHDKNILFIVDEANGVADEIITAIKGSMQGENAHLLLIGNPIMPSGYFYTAFNQKIAKTMHISAFDSPNVTGEKNIPGLADINWINDRKQEWGEESNIYQSRVLGEFPSSSDKSLFNVNSVTYCMTSAIPQVNTSKVVLGVDVARHGKDETVIAEMRGNTISILDTWKGSDITRIRSYVHNWWLRNKGFVGIDDTGIGGGVTDMCRELGIDVVAFIAGYRANNNTLFENLKAESLWQLSQAINMHEVVLPKDDILKEQFRYEEKEYTTKGKMRAIDPADSPDRLDAVNIAFYTARVTALQDKVYG